MIWIWCLIGSCNLCRNRSNNCFLFESCYSYSHYICVEDNLNWMYTIKLYHVRVPNTSSSMSWPTLNIREKANSSESIHIQHQMHYLYRIDFFHLCKSCVSSKVVFKPEAIKKAKEIIWIVNKIVCIKFSNFTIWLSDSTFLCWHFTIWIYFRFYFHVLAFLPFELQILVSFLRS